MLTGEESILTEKELKLTHKMARLTSFFSGGISRSVLVGSQNSNSDVSGVNLSDIEGVATQNRKMFRAIDRDNINPVAHVPTVEAEYIFSQDRSVYEKKGLTISKIGDINAYKGIDIFTSAALADIAIHNRVFVALDAVENQLHFGNMDEDGINSRIELDDNVHMLPAPDTAYRALGMNSSFLYTLDSDTTLKRFRLNTEGRIASNTATDITLPTYSTSTPVGIAVNGNGVFLIYANKRVRRGTTDSAGDITWNSTLINLSSLSGDFVRAGADNDTLTISQSDGIIAVSITDNQLALNTSSAKKTNNPETRGFSQGVDISVDTVVISETISVIFGSYNNTSRSISYEIESMLQSAIRYGDYIYYTTTHSLGRWEIGERFDTRKDMYKSFLNGNEHYHPMYQLADILYIGDDHVVAEVRQTDDTFIRNTLDVYTEFTIRCLGSIQNNLLIGTQGTSISSLGKSQVFIWDNNSDSWVGNKVIPKESITAFIDTGLFTVMVCGEDAEMYYFDGYNARSIQNIGDRKKDIEVLPQHVVEYDGRTYVTRGNRVYSVFGTYINAGNQGGTNATINGEYELEVIQEDLNDIDLLFISEGLLSCIRSDGFYTTSSNTYEDVMFSTRVMIDDANIAPRAKGFSIVFLRAPTGGAIHVQQIDSFGAVIRDLRGSFERDQLLYTVSGIDKRRDLRFKVIITAETQEPIVLLSTVLDY